MKANPSAGATCWTRACLAQYDGPRSRERDVQGYYGAFCEVKRDELGVHEGERMGGGSRASIERIGMEAVGVLRFRDGEAQIVTAP